MRQAEEGFVYITGYGPTAARSADGLPSGLAYAGAAATARLLGRCAAGMIDAAQQAGLDADWRGWRWLAELCLRPAGPHSDGTFVDICEVRYDDRTRGPGAVCTRIPARWAIVDHESDHVWFSRRGPAAVAHVLAAEGIACLPDSAGQAHAPRLHARQLTFRDLRTGAAPQSVRLLTAEPACRLWCWTRPQPAHAWRRPPEVVGGPLTDAGRLVDADREIVVSCCAHCGTYRIQRTDRRSPTRTSVMYLNADAASRRWVERRLQDLSTQDLSTQVGPHGDPHEGRRDVRVLA